MEIRRNRIHRSFDLGHIHVWVTQIGASEPSVLREKVWATCVRFFCLSWSHKPSDWIDEVICVIILHVDGQNQFYLSGFYITFLCSLLMQEKLSKDNLKDEQLFFKVGHHLMHCPPLHHLLLSFRFLRNRNHIFQKWALNMQTNE